jgi:3-deoxy-D-manno-octulosonic-acid transferase
MENFSEMSGKFLAAGAAIQVKNSKDLGAAWGCLLREPQRSARMGTCARELVGRNRGATQRVLEHIERIVRSDRGGR